MTTTEHDFDRINLTVCLASPTRDEHIKEALIAMGKDASVILTEYERFYIEGEDAEQADPGD